MGSLVKRNDHYSSLKIEGGCCVTAYVHGNYMGTSHKYCSDERCIVKQGLNDRISSIKIADYELYSSKTVGRWGNWGPKEYCPWNSYADGFLLKSQHNQGARDDTALNGIGLFCSRGGSINSATQKWGRWSESKYCQGSKNPIVGFDIKIDTVRHDETGANLVDMYCKDGTMLGGLSETSWGSWSPKLKCPT